MICEPENLEKKTVRNRAIQMDMSTEHPDRLEGPSVMAMSQIKSVTSPERTEELRSDPAKSWNMSV